MFNRKRKGLGLVLVFFMYLMSLSAPFQSFATLPDEWRMFSGQDKQWNFALPVSGKVTVNDPGVVKVNGKVDDSFKLELNEPISFESASIGQTEMELKLFGSIPVKKWKVNVVPDLQVIPGGQTIGVKIKSDGILVVGHHLVTVDSNTKVSPGEEAQIMLGDIITKINNKPLNGVSEVGAIVEEAGKAGKPIKLTIVRNGKELVKQLTPALDAEDQAYRLGLYIRDSAAGVGTLTFYAPDQGVYGALGHVITDMDTQTPIPVGEGKIVHSNVTSISKSHNGVPGEKRAHFFKENKILGNIERNTDFGIFGKMAEQPHYGYTQEPVPVAFAEEVKKGPAKILTVVEGHKVEAFDIEVVHTAPQSAPATKGLVIKITDQRLLDKTGGIVQGMSGSPILQDGKLIGAVTHVFVNDPSSGYGCFIEWMLQDAGVMIKPQEEELQAG
ncbi:SpoIVB peptidase [Xylanibacillus composti]|uniref:SpoIVB peptidase n=1 Tax=Xylanibacillus composti TaxID=1572762 RepID=A0A8J4M3C3_9BACL|nr:SpoIVB peptidase [Xylanibacillus composti]